MLKHRHEHFALSDGRIIACPALVVATNDPDPFTKHEELIVYKRYKAVFNYSRIDEGTKGASRDWWDHWLRVAEVLPGRSVIDCITFYKENKEHFQF